jgi:hypothetical protein
MSYWKWWAILPDFRKPKLGIHIMLIFNYPSKKAMKEEIGKPLSFQETSIFGEEYESNGSMTGCNRPHLTGYSREFFATVTVVDGVITKVI